MKKKGGGGEAKGGGGGRSADLISASVAVVRCTEDGHHLLVMAPIISLCWCALYISGGGFFFVGQIRLPVNIGLEYSLSGYGTNVCVV